MKARHTLLAAAAALALTATTTAAYGLAHTNLTIGGSTTPSEVAFTGDHAEAVGLLTHWDLDFQCGESALAGTVFPSTKIAVGERIAEISDFQLDDCLMLGSMPFHFDLSAHADADVIVTEHLASAGDPVGVEITGIDGHIHSTGTVPWVCELAITGSVFGTFIPGDANADGYLDIDPSNFTLDLIALDGTNTGTPAPVDPVTGLPTTCGGQIATGDTMNMNGAFTFDTNGAGAINHG